jgi:glycine/D-amino acid oxidase-like deaminating enzyme
MGKNVIVVGAGLFGSVAAELARRRGHHVTVIDNREKYAASKASGCVLAPSWLTSLSKEQVTKAMEVLRFLYPVYDTPFKTHLGQVFHAHVVHPDSVLVKPDLVTTVEQVRDGYVVTAEGRKLNGIVLVAAGIWTGKLVETPSIQGLYGASLRLWGVRFREPLINVYRPYRQAVAYNMEGNKEAWFGDGTALVEKSWMKAEEDHIEATIRRCRDITGTTARVDRIKVRVGARPYIAGYKAGYFEQAGDRLWVSTGGAKNGTVLAAWQALRFEQEAL